GLSRDCRRGESNQATPKSMLFRRRPGDALRQKDLNLDSYLSPKGDFVQEPPALLSYHLFAPVQGRTRRITPSTRWRKPHAKIDFGIGCGLEPGARRSGGRATADRHQVQPRGRAGYAEGQGCDEIRRARGKIYRRQGEGGGLSQLVALQGQGRARSAPARRRADAGAVELEVRPDRRQGVRGVRPAVHPARPI